MREKSDERQKFTRLVDAILSVPHEEVKRKLEQEKAAKKRKKSKKSSASREGA
jgi:hypothetical protein